MSGYKRIFVLVLIMAIVALVIGATAIGVLYQTAFNEQRARLMDIALSRARLIEAIAAFDERYRSDYPGESEAAALSQITAAHERFKGFGETGEFTLGRRDGNDIVFLLRKRHQGVDRPASIRFDSKLAAPMRQALSGRSGWMVGPDYRGVTVLAAFEPVAILNLGIVAKMDLAEIRAPFVRAAGLVFAIGILVVIAGTVVIPLIGNPMIRKLQESEARFRDIAEAASDWFWEMGPDLRFTYISNRFFEITQLERDAVIGHGRQGAPEPDLEDMTGEKWQRHFARLARHEAFANFEYVVPGQDGAPVHISISGVPVFSDKGVFRGYRGAGTDVTARKKAEEAMRTHARQQAGVAELGQCALADPDLARLMEVTVHLVARLLEADLCMIMELRPDRADLLLRAGVGWKEGVVGSATVRAEKASQAGFTLFTTNPVIVDDLGAEKRFEGPSLFLDHGVVSGVSVIIGDLDRPYGVLGVHTTAHRVFSREEANFLQAVSNVLASAVARRRDEQALRESEKRFRRLVENAGDGVFLFDREGTLLDVNRRACESHGYAREELLRLSIADIKVGADAAELADLWERTIAGGVETYEGHHRRKDGSTFPVEVRLTAVETGGEPQVLALVRDITERKRAEEALRAAEAEATLAHERLLDAVESMSDGVLLFDRNDRLVLYNSKYRDTFAPTTDALTPGMAFRDVARVLAEDGWFPEATGRIEEWLRERAEDHRRPGQPFERRLRSGRWEQVTEQRTRDGGTVILYTDITERKAIVDSLRKLSRVVEQSPSGVIITDIDGRIEFVNAAFTKISGYATDEVLGRNSRMFNSGKTPKKLYDNMLTTVRSGRVWHGTLRNRRKDGTEYLAGYTISPIMTDDGAITHFVGIQQDITERVATERQLAQAQKIQSLGNLAGGIAHDFNNMLFPILALSNRVRAALPEGSANRKRMEKVVQAGEKARDLVARILAFSRQDATEREEVDISATLRETTELIRATLPSALKIKTRLGRKVGLVIGDAAQISSILVNLASNAADAMEGTVGELKITLSRVEVGPKFPSSPPGLEAGAYAKLTVSDTGHGMDRDTMERMFDPFFTTRSVGAGTGLGLATVQGIVTKHGGVIHATSTPGKGTTFNVFLPLVEKGKLH